MEEKTNYNDSSEFQAAVDEKFYEYKLEYEERRFRRPNAIIIGIPESDKVPAAEKQRDDSEKVKKILEAGEMGDAVVKNVIRVGKVPDSATATRPRPVKVVFNDEETKNTFLSKAVNDKIKLVDNFKELMLFADRTMKEREEVKKLVAEKNAKNAQLRAAGTRGKKIIIRRGQLVEIKVPPDPPEQ